LKPVETLSNDKQSPSQVDVEVLQQWRAGETVSPEAVKAFGLDYCFASEPIPDNVWTRMQGKSYKENPYIKRSDLRHIRILHWDYDNKIHIGEMVCNKLIADKLVDIFRKDEITAQAIMMNVHKNVQAVVGKYPYDIAVTRVKKAISLAKECGFPFRMTVEEA
jgi:hypothetical protein